MIDTKSYYQNDNLIERDLLRPRLLHKFDWATRQVLTKDWYENADAVLQAIEQQIAGTTPPSSGE